MPTKDAFNYAKNSNNLIFSGGFIVDAATDDIYKKILNSNIRQKEEFIAKNPNVVLNIDDLSILNSILNTLPHSEDHNNSILDILSYLSILESIDLLNEPVNLIDTLYRTNNRSRYSVIDRKSISIFQNILKSPGFSESIILSSLPKSRSTFMVELIGRSLQMKTIETDSAYQSDANKIRVFNEISKDRFLMKTHMSFEMSLNFFLQSTGMKSVFVYRNLFECLASSVFQDYENLINKGLIDNDPNVLRAQAENFVIMKNAWQYLNIFVSWYRARNLKNVLLLNSAENPKHLCRKIDAFFQIKPEKSCFLLYNHLTGLYQKNPRKYRKKNFSNFKIGGRQASEIRKLYKLFPDVDFKLIDQS